ncbi:glycerol kinase [Frankia sp. CcI156]|uniref:glycerol kinase GlpK n=1 Tax=Frankia TaxID=1854 RepID=UPI0003CFC61A|nr:MULTISPECIES: glycerol kinase GlpK [Frankia]ETA00957.1 glycerol kinase [Frankia sp. CcI6]EYT91065.1 glycerol kinase [Frankia casuarinae]KDA41947.1 glycerol kinase [Frankia sp. BMG5.23]KEZ37447.1 glycerol kinase [Frankia sp. CeD]OAA28859.1 glycerol kinase [Frankia casuarinae]
MSVPARGSLVAAVDQGTTGTTVCLLDRDGVVVGRGYTGIRPGFPRPGWVEQDPDELWRSVVDTVAAALAGCGRRAGELAALGITNQRETTVLWDRRTSAPVHPAIGWQDRRTAAVCERLTAEGHAGAVGERTGLVLDPYFSGTKIGWILDDDPGLRRRAGRGEIAFGTVDSWLVWKLTAGAAHVTDVTNASRTLLLDLAAATWSPEMLDLLGVPAEVLPAVAPSSRVYAETDPDAFLGVRIPVAAVIGDQQAALFAQGCFEPGQAKNTYGTGSFVLVNTGSALPAPQSTLLRTAAFQLDGEPVRYALEGAVLSTGAAVDWLRDSLGIIRDATETADLAASLTGNDGVYFVPALAGLGAPHWDPRARGALLGITRGTTRAHVVRAVLEGIAYRTRDVVEAMGAAGFPVRELRADGGAARNHWLMQFQADLLGVELDVPDNIETTALGSAYLAGLATGFFADREELAGHRRSAERYRPRLSRAERDRSYRRWLRAVDRARDWAKDADDADWD